MRLILANNQDEYEKSFILKLNPDGRRTVIGIIKDAEQEGSNILYGVQWREDLRSLTDDTILFVYGLNQFPREGFEIEMTVTKDSIFSGKQPLTPSSYLHELLNPQLKGAIAFVDESKYQDYSIYRNGANELQDLYDKCPIYKHIITFEDQKPKLQTLLDIILSLPEKDAQNTLMAFSYANKRLVTKRHLAERVLDRANIKDGQDLMTQEQQVEAFIQFSKLVADETYELIPDSMLNKIKASPEYQRILREIKAKGYGISKTQQFNVLQAAAYLLKTHKIIYNLSDMGAGKTLMTVESIYLMDLKAIRDFNHESDAKTVVNAAENMWLPSKNLIAPKLSVKSSWVDTFKLFYTVEKITDSQYKLSIDANGVTYYSFLNVSAFTARFNAISIDEPLPEPTISNEYLIVDEIHQLVKRPIARRRFFTKKGTPCQDYASFVLSGTLSNLTTLEWYNYAQWMGIGFGDSDLDDSTPKQMSSALETEINKLYDQIHDSAEKLSSEQRRYFDKDSLKGPQIKFDDAKIKTTKEKLFHQKYSSKLLSINHDDDTLQQALLNKAYQLVFDFNLSTTPNFQLFYQLVGQSAITAQSTQIAEELFGEQKKQHNADVINVPSSLTSDDINLLKALHKITTDYKIYKSPAIATAINNAILNLNDGLANETVYDIISHYASTNNRFFSYLATLDLDILKKLPKSGLIAQPDLEKTPKYRVLRDILQNDPDSTFLIVVNDYGSMRKLGNALGIETFTRTQLSHQLEYQDVLDDMFKKQNIVIVPQMMIKSSLDLIQANRLIQYQLNTEIADIIQTQNRINRIGQTRETKAYYIATDVLQQNIISLFLETYKNIRVAHKGIVELFVDMNSQVNVINDYISEAMNNIGNQNETPAFEPSFTPDGVMDLFGGLITEEPKQTDIEDDDQGLDEVIVADLNPQQLNLFSPLEQAMEHQLIPVA